MLYIDIDLDKYEPCDSYVIGRRGESNVTTFRIILGDQYREYSPRLEFRDDNANVYTTPFLLVEDGVAIYPLGQMLCKNGNLQVDLVLQKGGHVAKPFSKHFVVLDAISAGEGECENELSLVLSISQRLSVLEESNKSKSHVHKNIDTLDRIGADGDNLTFDGVSVGGNDIRVDELISDVSSLQQASHTHPNKPTLDKLTVTDGELFIDGKRLENVHVWKIQKDPVIPAEADGTLMYTVYGEDGLMNSDPYLVEIQGVLYRKPAPWKPGQLWVCRGGIWYLLTSEGKTNFDPSKVVQGGGDIIDGDLDDVYAPAPLPDEDGGADTDDVVLMPMGEPLHLMMREDFGSAPMYAMDSFIRQNDPKYDFYVDGTDGTRIRMVFDGATVFDVEVNGDSSADLPETFTVASINGYSSIEELPADMLEAYKTFCSFINTSVAAMGDGVPIAGKVEIPTRGIMWNRTYAIRLDFDSIGIVFAEDADEGRIAEEAYTNVYVYFPRDLDAAISGVDYFVGGVPQTTQGWHKWILNRLPNGKISLGALDLEAIV